MEIRNALLSEIRDYVMTLDILGFKELPLKHISSGILRAGKPDKEPNRETDMLSLQAELGNCMRCPLHKKRKKIVFGEGNLKTRLMFIGNFPGPADDEQGRPFTGRAGDLLTRLINRMGFKREDIYLTTVIKCRPPDNRNPEKDEITTCLPFLQKQIEIISPEVIVTLGSISSSCLLSHDKNIKELRGKFFDYKDSKVMPTFHPSYLLQNADEKWVTWNDAVKVLRLLGIEVIGS